MTTSAVVAIVAAAVAATAAGCTVYLLLRARAATRTLEQELERSKSVFDEVVARELERSITELRQALKLTRAESLSTLVEEERRITEERRRDVAERERDASARLLAALTEAERRVDERISLWASDLTQLQESLAGELTTMGQRLATFAKDADAKIEAETERLQTAVDEHRALVARLREDLDRSAAEVAKNASADLEQHAADRRRELQVLAEHLRRREQELEQQIDRELGEVMQRIGTQLGDVEHRHLEQVRRTVTREGTRFAEAAAQQLDGTFRNAREEAAKRLGRELDLAIERWSREAEGLLGERIEHLVEAAVQRVNARVQELTRRLEELGARN